MPGVRETNANSNLDRKERVTALALPWGHPGTVKDFVEYLADVVRRVGMDHVGISSDLDGGGGVDGFGRASEAPNVTAELVRSGYTEQEIAKIWGGNLLRVLERVEQVAAGHK